MLNCMQSEDKKNVGVCPTIQRKKWRDQCTFNCFALSTIDSKWAWNMDKAGQWRIKSDVNAEIADLELALEHCG